MNHELVQPMLLPRLAITYIFKAKNALIHFAIKCASFCSLNRGTSKRSACAAIGYLAYNSVTYANHLLERTDLT